jgi:penicillin-insensitive murein endopeptidase
MQVRTIGCLLLLLASGAAAAQDGPPFSAPVEARSSTKSPAQRGVPAKELFGSATTPAPLAARAIGSYARGCLAGGVPLPINGPAWQVMRLSRNRNWGHPRLLNFLEGFARDARSIGWPGLLIGDMAQPRGGPMITGHASHQIGLDADVWLTPMPNRVLTRQEREEMTAISMLKDPFIVDPTLWMPVHTRLIKLAASYPEVERIFVHPAIKQVLCVQAGRDRAWLAKVRPWWGHYYHFHIRIACPPGSIGCEGQSPISPGDGCGAELDDWFRKLRQAESYPATPGPPQPANPQLTLDDLPSECRTVLTAGGAVARGADAVRVQTFVDKPAGPPPPRTNPRDDQSFEPPKPARSFWGD